MIDLRLTDAQTLSKISHPNEVPSATPPKPPTPVLNHQPSSSVTTSTSYANLPPKQIQNEDGNSRNARVGMHLKHKPQTPNPTTLERPPNTTFHPLDADPTTLEPPQKTAFQSLFADPTTPESPPETAFHPLAADPTTPESPPNTTFHPPVADPERGRLAHRRVSGGASEHERCVPPGPCVCSSGCRRSGGGSGSSESGSVTSSPTEHGVHTRQGLHDDGERCHLPKATHARCVVTQDRRVYVCGGGGRGGGASVAC